MQVSLRAASIFAKERIKKCAVFAIHVPMKISKFSSSNNFPSELKATKGEWSFIWFGRKFN